MATEITPHHLVLSLDRALELMDAGDPKNARVIVGDVKKILDLYPDRDAKMFDGEPNDALLQLVSGGGNGTVPLRRKTCK